MPEIGEVLSNMWDYNPYESAKSEAKQFVGTYFPLLGASLGITPRISREEIDNRVKLMAPYLNATVKSMLPMDVASGVDFNRISSDNRQKVDDSVVELPETIQTETRDYGFGPQTVISNGDGLRTVNGNNFQEEIFNPYRFEKKPANTAGLDAFEQAVNNLPKVEYGDRPTREYAELPDLTDRRNYYENFRYNPKQAVRDWGNETPFTTTAQFNPFFKMGVEFADMMANPFRQTYFEDLENQNLAEDARRLQQERLDDIAKDKEETRRALDAKRYEYQQNINDTKYSDKIGDLQYKNAQSKDAREDALENAKLKLSIDEKRASLKKSSEALLAAKEEAAMYTPSRMKLMFKDKKTNTEIKALREQYLRDLDSIDSVEGILARRNRYIDNLKTIIQRGMDVPVPVELLDSAAKKNVPDIEKRSIFVRGVQNLGELIFNGLRSIGIAEDTAKRYSEANKLEANKQKVLDMLKGVETAKFFKTDELNIPYEFKSFLVNNGFDPNAIIITYDKNKNPMGAIGFSRETNDIVDFQGTEFKNLMKAYLQGESDYYLTQE